MSMYVVLGNIARADRVTHKRGNLLAERELAKMIARMTSRGSIPAAEKAHEVTETLLDHQEE